MSTSLEDYKQKRYKHGYPDFGPTRLPVIPMVLILTDRADGSLWLVSWNSTDFSPPDINGRISINSVPFDLYYGSRMPKAQDGVYLKSNYVLFVRSGRLGLDNEFVGQNIDVGPPEYARQNGVNTYRQINLNNPQDTIALPVRLSILSIGDPLNG